MFKRKGTNMNLKMLSLLVTLLSAFVLISCGNDESKDGADESTKRSPQDPQHLVYKAPDEWVKETPASKMRRAQYKLPGQDGAGDAEMAVFVFPGSGGAVSANIQRWIGQFKQPDGSNSADKSVIDEKVINGLKMTTVSLTGTYYKSVSMMGGEVEELKNSALLAVIVETEKDPWFFKITGPEETINYWKTSFSEFLQTIK
jgi:hypothetical protein